MLSEYLDTLGLMFSALPWILFIPIIIINFYGWWLLSLSVFSYCGLGQSSLDVGDAFILGILLGPSLTFSGTVPLFIMILN